jgi:hypothetical protein
MDVRNRFGVLGCPKRDDTTQKSTGKAKFTFAKSLVSKYIGWEVHPGLFL